jgi:hypothetical protein
MSLCRALPIWCFASTIIGVLIGKFVIEDTLKGSFWGLVIGTIPIWLLFLVGLAVSLMVREHPKCRCGRWKSADYEFLGYNPEPPMHFDYRCLGCDRHYRHRDGVCYDIDDQGNETPYMTQKGFFPWRPASST